MKTVCSHINVSTADNRTEIAWLKQQLSTSPLQTGPQTQTLALRTPCGSRGPIRTHSTNRGHYQIKALT